MGRIWCLGERGEQVFEGWVAEPGLLSRLFRECVGFRDPKTETEVKSKCAESLRGVWGFGVPRVRGVLKVLVARENLVNVERVVEHDQGLARLPELLK